MKCSKCGKEIANDSVFCEYCGEQMGKSAWQYLQSHAMTLTFVTCTIVLAIIFCLYVMNTSKMVSSQSSSPDLTYAENVSWTFPIGEATYSGYVVQDPSLGNIPHTSGVAKIIDGEYAGSVYDGDFNMGKMEGRTKYTLNNGDVFVGEFKDNQYDKGKYIISSSGEYFEGTFKNGVPDKGNWYDKNGNKI